MKKLFTPVVLALLTTGIVVQPSGAKSSLLQLFREDGDYADLLYAAQYHEKNTNDASARRFYDLAAKKATTDADRAKALLGMGRNTRVLYPGYAPTEAGKLKKDAYEKVLALPAVSSSDKIAALFGLAETNIEIGSLDPALTQLKQITGIPDASDADKFRAALWSGEILTEGKRYDEARAQLTPLLKRAGLELDDKLSVHYALALSYLRQTNFSDGLAELAKINNLAGVPNVQRVDLYLKNGGMLSEAGHHKAARDEYAKVASVPNVLPFKVIQARLKTGETYFSQADYPTARQTWQEVLTLPEGDRQAVTVWDSIAMSHLAQKDYPATREAYATLLALPTAKVPDKLKATLAVANTYRLEKNYTKARETLDSLPKLVPGPPVLRASTDYYLNNRTELRILAMRESATLFREEGNIPEALKLYLAMLELAPVNKNGSNPLYTYQTRDQVQQITDTLAKNPATMDAAYTLYEALEKIYPYEKNDAEAYIGMGDILAAKGKKAEAREKYQKAIELRANYDEGKLAKQKLEKLGA